MSVAFTRRTPGLLGLTTRQARQKGAEKRVTCPEFVQARLGHRAPIGSQVKVTRVRRLLQRRAGGRAKASCPTASEHGPAARAGAAHSSGTG